MAAEFRTVDVNPGDGGCAMSMLQAATRRGLYTVNKGSGKQEAAVKHHQHATDGVRNHQRKKVHSHKVALEEVFQLPLRCRISQVSDVQAATFGSAGKDSIVGSRLVVGGLARDGGIGQSVRRKVIDGIGSGVSDFLHDGRHGDCWDVELDKLG